MKDTVPENGVMMWQDAELHRPSEASSDKPVWMHGAAWGGVESWKQCPELPQPQDFPFLHSRLPWMLSLSHWHGHWNNLQKQDKQYKVINALPERSVSTGRFICHIEPSTALLEVADWHTKSRHFKSKVLFKYIYAKSNVLFNYIYKVKQRSFLNWRKLHFHWKNKAAGRYQCYYFIFT